MFKKRYGIILLLFLIFICAISQVNASENSTVYSSNASEIDSVYENSDSDLLEEYSDCDSVYENSDSDLLEECSDYDSSNENVIIGDTNNNEEIGTFTELFDLIYYNYRLNLDKDYAYFPNIDTEYGLDGGIIVPEDFILNGNGHTIYGNGARTFLIYPFKNIKIYNLNFVNVYGSDDIDDSVVPLERGGAILVLGAEVTFENCTFINNYAKSEGGVISSDILDMEVEIFYPCVTIRNCTFINNSVNEIGNLGGAISSRGKLLVYDSKFYNCSGRYGGAIGSYGEAYIKNCYFEDNVASTSGGAIYNLNSGVCDVTNCSFYNNVAQFGGAIYNSIVSDCYFDSNNYASTKKGHKVAYGVMFGSDLDSDDYFNVMTSNGFSFNPIKLSYDNISDNDTLDIQVINNLDGSLVKGVQLNVTFENEYGYSLNYLISTQENGIANVSLYNFTKGIYNLTVSFVVKYYNNTEKTYQALLGKLNSKISFTTKLIFEYGVPGLIFVTVDGGSVDSKNIKILNYNANIKYSKNEITVSGLPVGKYKLQVTSTPDDTHLASVATVDITVKKATAVIKASKITVAYKKGMVWSITIINPKTGKGIPNMNVKLKIFTGKKSKTVTVRTNSKGVAKYKTSKLSKGKHKVIVSATHKSFTFNTLTSSIKVVKSKDVVIKVKKKMSREGSSVLFTVRDKATKKGINGVKIYLYIYTGKKIVKKITLKTKKVGKTKGYAGYFTNELSVGKHKVKIVTAQVKYDGSKTTSLKIKKSFKKYPKKSSKVSG